ncbi:MAG: efflux RND transporter periplasmic adaptor subunit [Saprospiraceae bacterium]
MSKSNNRWIWVLGIVVLLLLGYAAWKAKSKPKGEKVNTETVQKRTIKEKVSASGKVFPEVEVKISSDVSGEVVELLVQEGDSVKKGQLLCRINPDNYVSSVERGVAGLNSSKASASQTKTQIANAKARKAQAEANLANAKSIFARNQKLLAEGVISQEAFDNVANSLKVAETTLQSAEADYAATQETARAAEYNVQSNVAGLKELQTNLKRTSIYAPSSGIVSRLNIEKGERVVGTIQMTGTEIMRIADFKSMEVQVDVSENDIPRVSLGDEVDIEIDAYSNRKFKGKVYQIANSASNTGTASATLSSDQVTNFIVKIRIDPASYVDLISKGRNHPFRPGMSAAVEISTEEVSDVFSVPIQSVTTRDREVVDKDKKADWQMQRVEKKSGNKDFREVVFVVDGNKVKMVEVETGIQDDTYIQILSGLSDMQEVVSGPYEAVSRKLKTDDLIYREEQKDKKK